MEQISTEQLLDICSIGRWFGLEWGFDISAVPEFMTARLKSSQICGESSFLFKNYLLDLQMERDRINWFLLMLKDTPASITVDCVPVTTGFIDIRANLLCFEYVIQQRTVGRILQDIVNDPSPSWRQDNLRIICYHLMHHRLILRHIFQKTELWRPLLSAQIKVLEFISIQSFDDPVLLCLMASMKHWTEKHFEFAVCRLYSLFHQYGYMDMLSNHGWIPCEPGSKEAVKYHVSDYVSCSICYFYGKIDDFDFDMPQVIITGFGMSNEFLWVDGKRWKVGDFIRKRIIFEQMRERECGWPPCSFFNGQKLKRKEMKPTFKCKGCKLIRYCCRNHQKKHWKFVHRQQCMKIGNQ